MKHTVFIALGTNIGDREENLNTALDALQAQISIIKKSQLYETKPWGYLNHPKFLNMVLKGETALSPNGLLSFLKSIEEEMGREKTIRYGPRNIDLDVLYYDDMMLESDLLTIPHKEIRHRDFVLYPLCEIAPDWLHPKLKQNILELLVGLPPSEINLAEYPKLKPAYLRELIIKRGALRKFLDLPLEIQNKLLKVKTKNAFLDILSNLQEIE